MIADNKVHNMQW